MPSAPRPRRFYLDSDDEWDEDYDVFLFYPSRNRVIEAGRQACYAPLANTITPYHQQCENPSWEWDDNDASSGVLEHFPSPTYSVDPDFVFPDDGHDGGIASMGYSKIFRSGLWAQSCGISGRLRAFISKTVETLRTLKGGLTRRLSRQRDE